MITAHTSHALLTPPACKNLSRPYCFGLTFSLRLIFVLNRIIALAEGGDNQARALLQELENVMWTQAFKVELPAVLAVSSVTADAPVHVLQVSQFRLARVRHVVGLELQGHLCQKEGGIDTRPVVVPIPLDELRLAHYDEKAGWTPVKPLNRSAKRDLRQIEVHTAILEFGDKEMDAGRLTLPTFEEVFTAKRTEMLSSISASNQRQSAFRGIMERNLSAPE